MARDAAMALERLQALPRDCIECGERWEPVELDGQIISLQCPACGGEYTLGTPIPLETWESQQSQPYVPTRTEILQVLREEAKRGIRGRGSRRSGRQRKKKPVRRRTQLWDVE